MVFRFSPIGVTAFTLVFSFSLTACSTASEQSAPAIETEATVSAKNDVASNVEAGRRVVVIDFGGTIAGESKAPNSISYKSGERDITDVVVEMIADIEKADGDVPDFLKTATIDQSLPSGGSSALTEKEWVLLHNRVTDYLADPSVAGVVVTHGTDTLEETAFFLHLTVKSVKPVVFVGAMRASTQFGADGPLNLYNAMAIAADRSTVQKGVMVVLNDTVHSARHVTKSHTTAPDTFIARNAGPIGKVRFGKVRFFGGLTRPHTLATPFDANKLLDGPADADATKRKRTVDILYHYAGNRGDDFRDTIKRGSDGIVYASSGQGALGGDTFRAIRQACKDDPESVPPILVSSRTGAGFVSSRPPGEDSPTCPILVGADDLNPQKARILLLLALSHGWTSWQDLKAVFEIY